MEDCKVLIPNALHIPTLNMTMFDCMSNNAKQLIVSVAAVGTSVTKTYYHKKSFGNRERQNLFAKALNKNMSYPDLRVSFEYYEIIVSAIDS